LRYPTDRDRKWLTGLAVALLVWGAWGFFDANRWGRGGYVYSPTYVVEGVEQGGAAQEAGLRAGDRVLTIDGIPVEDLPLYSRWPRDLAPRPGEALPIVVERGADTVAVEVVYRSVPGSNIGLRLGAGLIGLSFMLFGLWALFTVSTPQALALAWVGMAAGVATFGKGPYLGTWDGVTMHIQLLAVVLWSLLLLRFFLIYPKPKRVVENRVAKAILLGAWLLLVPLLVLELILHPALYHAFGGPASLLIGAYLLLAVVALIHTVAKTPRADLREAGMGWMLAGLLVVLIPNLLAVAGWLLLPDTAMPGARYLPLLIAVIPLSMALAVRKQAASATTATA